MANNLNDYYDFKFSNMRILKRNSKYLLMSNNLKV